jgi:hypothetical protein
MAQIKKQKTINQSTKLEEMEALFGPTLLTKNGVVPTQEALAGKVVGIYFSAHW